MVKKTNSGPISSGGAAELPVSSFLAMSSSSILPLYLSMPDSRFLTAYVDLPFIEEIFRNKPDEGSAPYNERELWEVWHGVFDFLQRHARVILDGDLDGHPELQRFFLHTGEWDLDLQPGASTRFIDPQHVSETNPYTIFLLEDPDIPVDDLRQETGLLFLRYEDLEHDWLRLFKHHNIDVGVEADRLFEWGRLRQHGSPLNAIVVADKYAYKQFSDNTFEENLGALLLSFLPERINNKAHITLVTDFWKAYEENQGVSITPNEIHDCIEDYLKQHRPDLEFAITVSSYRHGAGHKDRFIITNYALFTSNHSLDFFRSDGTLSKETFVHHLPLSENGSKVRRRIRRLADISSNPPSYPLPGKQGPLFLGSSSGGNRLLNTSAL